MLQPCRDAVKDCNPIGRQNTQIVGSFTEPLRESNQGSVSDVPTSAIAVPILDPQHDIARSTDPVGRAFVSPT